MRAHNLEDVIDTIAAAPFRADGWSAALNALAEISGGWGGQMIAQADTDLRFTAFANVSPEAIAEYLPSGCADPAQSPRLAAGLRSPLMKPVSDQDYIATATKSKYRIYRDYYERHDAYFCASARIEKLRDLSIVVALFHSKGSGDFDRAQLALFEKLLPHVRGAFETNLAIDAQAARLALGAFEDFSLIALVCDAGGRLIAASPAGEAFLRSGEFLNLRGGVVRAVGADSAEPLERALRLARAPVALATPAGGTVTLADAQGVKTRRANVAPFPKGGAWGFGAAVLIAVAAERRGADPARLRALGLSVAEAQVALLIAEGRSAAEVAVRRNVGLETVRSQLKNIHARLGVRNTAQLAARLGDLG